MAMNRWERIDGLLDQALDLPSDEVAAFLDRECAGDAALRAEVEELLAAEAEAGGFLETPASELAEPLIATSELEETLSRHGLTHRQLGPYRLLRWLGGGGMGVVYEAEDTRLRRHVAIKLLPREWSRNPDAKERFQREARAASALDHPNICILHDIGESPDGQLYLVMAHYPGETLKQVIARGPLPVDEAREIAIQVARGLARAHAAGIVHRDVKPANVMVTEPTDRSHGELSGRGRAAGDRIKVLDFGVAKIAGEAALTHTGRSVGTPYYMSPEQIYGDEVDERSDVWSLGVLLYEMLAGRRPFAGNNQLAISHSIRRRDPVPLREARPEVPVALERVVAKMLAKDPADRYQSVPQLLADLEEDTEPTLVLPRPRASGFRRRGWVAAAVAVLLLVAVAVGWRWREGPAETSTHGAAVGESRGIAVLYFQNLIGDPDLDWLRRGLTDMLVTDLAQSPDLEVLSTARLAELMEGFGGAPGKLSLGQIRRLAKETGASMVVQGSFARLGEIYRIDFTLEAASDGAILKSDSFKDRGEESLLAMIDELSAAIRNHLEVIRPAASPPTARAGTTSSLDAWRFYQEGLDLYRRSKLEEAVPLLERAIEIDPGFALALATLGRLYANLGEDALGEEYLEQAVQHADRLPLHQRFAVEGAFYGRQWEGYGQAIEAYREAAGLYPEDKGFRSNLGTYLAYLERYDEAAAELDRLIAGGTAFEGTYSLAASIHAALGRWDEGHAVLADYAKTRPESWYLRFALGWSLTHGGHLDEAEIRWRQASELRPGVFLTHYLGWRVYGLRGDWSLADRQADALLDLGGPLERWLGWSCRARGELFRGRSQQALELFESATGAYPEPAAYTALARIAAAEVLLESGQAERALAEATRARSDGRGQWPELQSLFLIAVAAEMAGQTAVADDAAAALEERWRASPNPVEERLLLHLEGRRALVRGEVPVALDFLGRAVGLLPARGLEVESYAVPDHVPLWSALASAYLAAGDPRSAATWWEKVVLAGTERLPHPVPWVRAHFQLGRARFELGEVDDGRRLLLRYLDLWRDADLDSEPRSRARELLERSAR